MDRKNMEYAEKLALYLADSRPSTFKAVCNYKYPVEPQIRSYSSIILDSYKQHFRIVFTAYLMCAMLYLILYLFVYDAVKESKHRQDEALKVIEKEILAFTMSERLNAKKRILETVDAIDVKEESRSFWQNLCRKSVVVAEYALWAEKLKWKVKKEISGFWDMACLRFAVVVEPYAFCGKMLWEKVKEEWTVAAEEVIQLANDMGLLIKETKEGEVKEWVKERRANVILGSTRSFPYSNSME
jgi:hypothetical protein